jgi:drug/metabolite transporter (DMT)-like permease
MSSLRRPVAAAAVALAAVYLIWGSTYLGVAVAVRSIPPLLMLSLRFLVAGGILYAWSIRRGDRVGDRPGLRQWRAAAVVGGLLLFVDTGLVAWAMQRGLDTGLAALLCATIPLWLVGIDGIVGGKRLSRGTVGGMGIGLIGVAVLVGPSAAHLDLPAVLAVLVGTIAWAGGSIYARTAALPKRPNLGAGMEMIAAGVLLAIGGVATGELGRFHPTHVPLAAVGALLYLIVFGSLLAYTAYGWLLRNASTTVVSTHAYVNPVVAVALGAAVLGEPITGTTVFAGLLVVLSVVLIIGLPKRPKRAPMPRPVGLATPALADFSRLAA